MDNLALNKPALQSSVSDWSSSRVPAEAAQGGNDGDLSRDFGIHTDGERDPWWQVDLQATCAVARVCVFNRNAFPERLLRFSVLGSLDGVDWDLLASKSDDDVFGPDGEPFVLDLPERPVLRYLRVRLDGLDCLHFKECQVFGTPADPDAAPREHAAGTGPERIVFSALYNESDAFLDAYLANFLHYTGDESVLLVNLPPGRTIPDVVADERVVLFNGATHRFKFGHTLLMGHLESFDLATRKFDGFDYFCPLASNSLFVRHLDSAAVIRQLRAGHRVPVDLDITYDIGLDIDRLPGNWHWPKIARNQLLIDFLKTRWGLGRLSQNQIEGLVASRIDWSLLHKCMVDLPAIGELLMQEASAFLPLEEILPATFFLGFGTGCYVNICHVFWDRFNHSGSGLVTIDDLLAFSKYPTHLCLLKWFERDAAAIETAAVTQPWSRLLLAEYAKVAVESNVKARLAQRFLLQNLATSLHARETAEPFTKCWRSPPNETLRPCMFRDDSLVPMRQIIRLPTHHAERDDRSDAYLYLENTHHHLKLAIQVEHAPATRLQLNCDFSDTATDQALAATPVLEGYLYMRVFWPDEPPVVRVCVPTDTPGGDRTMQHVVIMCDEAYVSAKAMHVERNRDTTDYHFSRNGLAKNVFWLGIPFFTVNEFSATLEVVHVKPP